MNHMLSSVSVIENNGKLHIPSKLRKSLGIRAGEKMVLQIDNGELHVIPLELAIRKAQEIVAKHVPKNHSLSKELIQDRRQEAKNE